MAGWFGDSAEERRKKAEAQQAEEDGERNRRIREKKRKRLKEFQALVDGEVAKHIEANSPDAKKARLAQLHGSSSLLNGALGVEYAVNGDKKNTPGWMNPSNMGLMANQSGSRMPGKDLTTESEAKTEASAAMTSSPRLNRPY